MALVEGCKHVLELAVPKSEVSAETERVVANIQKKVKLPGFRPGKAPTSLIRSRFQGDIRQDVIENLVPKVFQKKVEEEGLRVVGRPSISDVHFHEGEGIHFKIEFEVVPEFDLKDPGDLTVEYREPKIEEGDVEKRLEELREQKAEYVNIDPRPVEDGDYAVVALESLSGAQPPVKSDDVQLHVGSEDTLPAFSDALRGMEPDQEKEFDIEYPEDYGEDRLAGKQIRFRMRLKTLRRKELPELSDDFAQDMGDFRTMDELREEVRKSLFREREFLAKQEAKNQLIDKLVESHDFPVPQAYIERQIESQAEQYVRGLAARGVDVQNIRLDWEKLKESQTERATRDVKASLLLDKLADRESIFATQDEVDREVQRVAKQRREAVAAVRMKLQKEGALDRIANHIRTEKTLDHLFDRARKEVPAES